MKRKAKILFVQVVSKDYHILLGRRVSSGESFWWIPGGSVETGEREFEAALRELDEELILTSAFTQVLLYFIHSSTEPQQINYQSEKASNTIFIVPINIATKELPGIKDEFEELQWFNLDSLPSNMSREFSFIKKDFTEIIKNSIA
jgi:ADP-ribose pyrophosphatase YjhB (NUDIX family)